jgi:hypothetical protein
MLTNYENIIPHPFTTFIPKGISLFWRLLCSLYTSLASRDKANKNIPTYLWCESNFIMAIWVLAH